MPMDELDQSYTIAFTPRSGSNALCELLALNGIGHPSEFFQYPYDNNFIFDKYRRLPTAEAIALLIREHSQNRIFGCKMNHDHLAHFEEAINYPSGTSKTIQDYLPSHKWIWLRRRDKLSQAISLFRAQSTNVWAKHFDNLEEEEVEYDFFAIMANYMMLCVNDLAWHTYFANNNISPLVLFYEELFRDIRANIDVLLEYLELSNKIAKPFKTEIKLQIQRDSTSEEFRGKFLRDLVAVGRNESLFGLAENRWNAFFFEKQWRDDAVQEAQAALGAGQARRRA